MIHFINVKLQQVAVHKVGNKILDEGIKLSDNLIDLKDEKLGRLFLKYFLSSFSGDEIYNLHHDIGLELNEVYVLAKKIFSNSDGLLKESKNIAQHLHNSTMHPKIKNGELYVVYFTDIILDDEVTDAIGLFKSETKDNYLKVDIQNKKTQVDYAEGTNTNKLDKGCLILNIDEEKGYKVCIIDNLNKSNEAIYWKDNFLNIKPVKDEFHQTHNFLSITKEFVTQELSRDTEISKAEQIDLLNRSVDYFKTHNTFDKDEFENSVLIDTNVIDSFKKFDENYRQENELELSDNFEISPQAVKKQTKIFKSVLKLDKNFDIYIRGDRKLIEKGTEKDGRKFYKIYYQDEA